MYNKFKEQVRKMKEELEYIDYVSPELQEEFNELENQLERATGISSGAERKEMEELLVRLRGIKSNYGIV